MEPIYDFCKGPVKFIRGGKYPFCHSVLVEGRARAVIDASSDQGKLESFKRMGRVDYLITSHAHEDHLVYNHLFPESTFCAHPFDAPFLEDLDSLIQCYGDMPREELDRWRKFLREECHFRERKVDLLLEDSAVLDLGGVQLEVVHTPGHTRGHLAFYFPEERILFTADLDLTSAGPYYADRASSIEDILESLQRLKTYPAELYLTGHGKGILPADPAWIDRYAAIVLSREERLIEFLTSGPKTLGEVVNEGIIYGRNPKSMGAWDLSLSERGMMIKHLDHLIRKTRVREDAGLFHLLS